MLVENKDLKKDVTRPKLFLRTYIVTNLNEKKIGLTFLGRHMAWRPNNPLIAYKDDKDEVFTLLFFFRIFFFAYFFLRLFFIFFWGPFLHHVYLQVFFMKF